MKPAKKPETKEYLKKLGTGDMANYLNKIESHMANLQKALDRHALVKKVNKFFDHDGKLLGAVETKLNELGQVHNDIHLEIERRILEDCKLDLEYEKYTEIDGTITTAYLKDQGLITELLLKEAGKKNQPIPDSTVKKLNQA